MFSEKRTYIFNGELIFIKKVKQDMSKKFYNITYESLETNKQFVVKDKDIESAVKTVDSTEFFQMWMHFNNWKNKEDDYTVRHCISVINKLSECKIELHGSNKFEEYDLIHLADMYNFTYGDSLSSFLNYNQIIHKFDGGYNYHNV